MFVFEHTLRIHTKINLYIRLMKLISKVLCFILSWVCLTAIPVSAQPSGGKVTVTGVVVDESSTPVIGAAVLVKDAPSLGGVMTDANGEFTFTVPAGSVILISCVGYQNWEKAATAPERWFVTLTEDTQMIEETVVVGYGVQRKESVVGAISQVGNTALVNSGTVNVGHALTGKLSGVETFQTSGQPGNDDVTIVIRGQSSWNGNEPLVMVDGVERSFLDLNPNEIETISVLKDASATAVFGAKGANGVILVTTKTGLKGKPKMGLTVNFGVDNPTFLPEHIPGDQVLEMTNIALKNQQSFASQYSADEIKTTRDQSNPLRYPDNDWYGMMMKTLAPTLDANFTLSGGSEKATYFVSVGYLTDNSLVKKVKMAGDNTYQSHRFNYRSNIDVNLSPSTKLSLKFGGSTSIKGKPAVTTTKLFSTMYTASGVMYPAYFPDEILTLVPDPNYPGETGIRVGSNNGAYVANPYYYIMYDSYQTSVINRLNTDAILRQNLDFLTKGLYVQAKASLTTQFLRYSKNATQAYPTYDINWSNYDAGANPWVSSSQGESVLTVNPYKESQNNIPTQTSIVFYWEASLNYNRSFGNHNVTALALMSRREGINDVDFPSRTEAFVGRITYDYKQKYLFEANVGYTGSEQFAPANRYGLFPSVAVGYAISKEEWWKTAMPWWNKMKIRYSDGLVGSDAATEKWLYFSSYSQSNGTYQETTAANETARWETARKRDLGIEMGWLDDKFSLTVDLFDEHRKDMLVTPVVTPLVAIDYKDINAGELKKHGIEIEPKFRNRTAGGFYYEIGAMLGFNENRILAYPDKPSQPSYQWYTGTAFGSQRMGMNQAGNGFFNNVDDLHAYPVNYATWDALYPGIYKFTDFNADTYINTDDFHPISGTTYPVCTYSLDFGFSYKHLSFHTLLYGNQGKYTNFQQSYDTEYWKGDLVIHKAQTNYWTPTNNDSRSIHRTITFNTLFTSQVSGAEYAFLDHTWMKSDFLTLKEMYLAYRFDAKRLKNRFGVDALTVTLTGNNLFTLTNLIEGDPQIKTLYDSYYPIVRVVKLGVKLDF